VIHNPPEWDSPGDKKNLIAAEDLVEPNKIVILGSRRIPGVRKRCLAAVETLRDVMEHQGNVATNQVTLPALTPHQLGTHLPECMFDTDSFHV